MALLIRLKWNYHQKNLLFLLVYLPTTDITVTVTDANGNKVKRETINLSVDKGTIQTPAVNNGDGTYTATYAAADVSGDVTISALTSNGIFSTLQLKLVEVSVSAAKSLLEITSSATPQTGEKATVVVTALSDDGLALSGRVVELKISPETKVVVDPSAKTDKDGRTEITFTTGKPEMKVIKASVDGIELSSTRAVMFSGSLGEVVPIRAGIAPNRIRWEKDSA
ncbi:MAG: invasin domain 3-containing protein, partial [Anaerolineales bacterium]|nr:invasin domain 3-containing protein [Anaerolineales bacterium]